MSGITFALARPDVGNVVDVATMRALIAALDDVRDDALWTFEVRLDDAPGADKILAICAGARAAVVRSRGSARDQRTTTRE